MTLPLALGDASPWRQVTTYNVAARELADRHYSRQQIGAPQFAPPGRRFVLLAEDALGRAVWVAVHNLDPAGAARFRCTLFRNESGYRSSDLVRHATAATLARWAARGWPHPPLRTEVDPDEVRRKRDPGRCFLRAGWRHVRWIEASHGRSRKRELEAPC